MGTVYLLLLKLCYTYFCVYWSHSDYNLGDGPGELSDGETPEAESETDFISEKGKITPRKFSPYEQAFHDDKLEGYTEILDEPLESPDVLDDTASNVYPEVSTRDTTPADEKIFEGWSIFLTWSILPLLELVLRHFDLVLCVKPIS